jgi:multidrug efflux pump subunit AcrB
MKGLIRASLGNPHAVIVGSLAVVVLGGLTLWNGLIPIDILPVFRSPAVQVLTFYGGMPAEGMEKDITNRMERWTGQTNGLKRQESRSILGASIVRNYFFDDVDVNGALTQVNSLALATLPNLPPGTLPPVVLPFDPTSTTPVAIVALHSDHEADTESILYDVGRYQIRNYIMQVKGASAPVVIGGKLRAVMLYLKQTEMQARGLTPADVMDAVERSNIFFPSGDVKIGDLDFALSSNSMYTGVERMKDIPLRIGPNNASYLGDVADPKDAAFIQTNIVRIGGPKGPSRKQVYIPVYRQVGSSTLEVVKSLKAALPKMEPRIQGAHNVKLDLVMDQSVYVRESIFALVQEASLGAVLCALVILLFLGEWRMTLIAVLTLPLSVLMAIICLKYTGQTINVMTLAGLTLAIGPMIDSAIICLENTHRHLGMGADPHDAALDGASEVAMPELVSTLCTFLVLAPLALMPGMGKFLFLPMMLAVMFAMTTAYILSRTLVPCFSYVLLKAHGHGEAHQKGAVGRLFARWEQKVERGIQLYVRSLNVILRNRVKTVVIAFALLAATLVAFAPILRRDFFPEMDAGAFEVAVRAAPGLRIEKTEDVIAQVEDSIRKHIGPEDLKLIVSEIGLTADWSSAYTVNAGPQDAILKVQLSPERSKSAQEYVSLLRRAFKADRRFANLEFAFDTGGMVRGALNEGKSTPINIQIKGKNQELLHGIADRIKEEVRRIDGVVDARVIQKLDAPELTIEVNRTKAAQLGLSQDYIMKNVIAATNSSIAYNKKNFWIDSKTGNQYFVGVAYPETKIKSIDDLYNIPIRAPNQPTPILLKEVATIRYGHVPTEIHHVDLQPAIDLEMGVEGRDLGHVCDDVARVLAKHGRPIGAGEWTPYAPGSGGKRLLSGSSIVLSGEYSRMQATFSSMSVGLVLACLLIYFLMVALDRSFIVPLSVMLAVPLCLVGVLPMLYVTGSAVNVQSLLGVIFILGIAVSNMVLMTDYAQELRRHEGLSPLEAIRKAAALRVRPVTMTALAALFAMLPTALALEKGSEANAPLARAILGGLLAVEPATLFVLPCLYSLLVRDGKTPAAVSGHTPGGEVAIRAAEQPHGPSEGLPDLGRS